jgi:hypothetical protein
LPLTQPRPLPLLTHLLPSQPVKRSKIDGRVRAAAGRKPARRKPCGFF